MAILNFGSCNIDYVYSLDHIVLPGETISSSNLELFPGGKGLNQSIAAAKAGAKVYHAGCIGNDGEMLRDTLLAANVDLSYLTAVDVKNGHAIIQVNTSGENSIVLYPGSNVMVTKEMIDEVLSHFSKEDILLLQNEISNVDYLIEQAYRKGMIIAFNPAPFEQKLKKIDFNMLSYLIVNETEAAECTDKTDPDQALAYLRAHYPALKVVLTLGKHGCIYSDQEQTLRQPTFSIKVVDTTAAGDTFIGYFLAALEEGKTEKEAIHLASLASTLTVSRKGAAPSIPYLDEVKEARKTLKPCSDNDNQKESVQQIIDYLNHNLKNASLAEVAAQLNYSKNYTGELIKKKTGLSFSAYLQKRRTEVAAELLKSTNLPIGEIIEQVGYANESFFRQKFKLTYGVSPLQYRQNQKRENG